MVWEVTMTYYLIQYLFLFVLGCLLGWGLEVVYRKYFGKARQWINPGFLSGPFLPLYGTGLCILYFISDKDIHLGLKILLFAISTTAIEYVTGLFFLKYYKTRLWDYTPLKFNIQGVIAPMYSFFWTILSLVFYFGLYPLLSNKIDLLYEHLEYSLIIGIFMGFILMDVSNAFNLANRLKTFVDNLDEKKIINFEVLKAEIKEKFEELADKFEDIEEEIKSNERIKRLMAKRAKPTFFSPFKDNYELSQRLQEHILKRKSKK